MRSESPPLLPILRSAHLADILALLVLHQEKEFSLTELSARLGFPLTTVQREVNRLIEAGLLTERRLGRNRLVTLNGSSRYARPLAELITQAFGPHIVVAEEFGQLPAIAVGIFGSWAARYQGVTGPPPNDLDVLVIGDAARAEIYDAADRTERRVGFPVNPVLCSVARWESAADALIQQIRSAPVTWVVGQPPRSGDT